MNFEHELITVILNEGYSDFVMDAARAAGAGGGTVLHAKGTGGTRGEKFFSVSLADEKDMIYIIAHKDEKAAIMRSINEQAGTAMVKYRNIETPLTTYLDYLHPTTPVNEGDTDV